MSAVLGSPGQGSSPHLAGEMFKRLAKVDAVHVPYKGTADQMLAIEGKEELAQAFIGEISNVMGYDYEHPDAEPEVDAKGKKKKKRPAYNPVESVLFSSFIVQ